MVSFPTSRTEALTEPELCSPGSGVRVGHILLVTRSFPPINLVSSLRMYQWAKYWSRDGRRVTVLTTKKHWFSGPCDLEWPALPGVNVVEVEFLPSPLLRVLERWRSARAVGRSRSGPGRLRAESARVVGVKTWWRRARLSWRLLPALEFYDLWVAKAVRAGTGIMASDPADVIVSSFGPPAAHKIGARLKRRFPDVRWVADYRDPWTFHENFVLRGLTGHLERRREHMSVGRGADLLACVSNRLAEQTRLFTAKPVIVVENGFDPEEQASLLQTSQEVPEPVRAAWAPVTLVYTGTLHLDYQDPTPLLRAIGDLVRERDPLCEKLRVLFFGERQIGLQRLIDGEAAERQVRMLGYVDRPTALWAQRNASALLLFENQESAARGVLRAKMFEYLQAGRPILGIGFGPDTEVGRILTEARVGRVCGADPDAIREALRRLGLDGEVDGFAPEPTVLARFRRDRQARRLLRAMDVLLESRSGSDRRAGPHCTRGAARIVLP
jgi:hypothetical protein